MTKVELDLKVKQLKKEYNKMIKSGYYTVAEATRYFMDEEKRYYKQYRNSNPSWVKKLFIKLGIIK